MRANQFIEAALGTSPKRPSRPGSRPERGHEPQERYGISKDKETEFHAKLDKLVHNTFGKRDDEMEESGSGETHISPSGVKTNMPPTDDDYAINYGKNGLVAKFRKEKGLDVATGSRKVNEGKTQKQEAPKPRNFVAKNAINTGAGAHKDKKKAAKQGDVKHKGKMMDIAEMENILERGKASRSLCVSSKPDSELGASQLASCKSQGLRARDGKKSHLMGKGPESRMTMGGHKVKGKKYGGKIPDWGTRKGQK